MAGAERRAPLRAQEPAQRALALVGERKVRFVHGFRQNIRTGRRAFMKSAFDYREFPGSMGSGISLTPREMEEREALDQEAGEFEWEAEVNRKSRDYIRWVQQ